MESFPDLSHLADTDPVPGSEALRSIVERHQRRRSRRLAAGLAAVAVAGPALGFALAMATTTTGDRVSAGQPGATRTTTPSGATTASGLAALGVGSFPVPFATRVFLRTTADGIRIRAYQPPDPKVPSGVAPPQAPACRPTPLLLGELSDDLATGQTFSISWDGQPAANPMIVGAAEILGLIEGSPMWTVTVRTAPNVATVVFRFVDGSTDQMAPVKGWAILAHHTTLAAVAGLKVPTALLGTAEAFDAAGKSLGTTPATMVGPKLPPGLCLHLPPKPMGDGMRPLTPGS